MANASDKPLNTVAKGAVDGTGAFLSRICLPAAEEFGEMLRDTVKHWRNKNFVRIAQKAEKLVEQQGTDQNPNIHPRILHKIYEEGSWSDDEDIQKMWAGLFAASCFDDGVDAGVFYLDILSKVSVAEARIFRYVCNNSEWRITRAENLVEALPVFTEPGELRRMSGLKHFEDVDEAIAHLELLGLTICQTDLSEGRRESYDSVEQDAFDVWQSGSDGAWSNHLELSLTKLGIRLYLKVQGISQRPSQYFRGKL
ncbi:Abi-alpha family protein [Wenzhouxiangella sp. EGI_FJ10409]|uniref:Abi-alpha family protein n=1 Tax=Wenzhouxiangella sp. EGI_FJ10409 TaxID=3243767 RepID=UPI0035DC9629